MTVNLASCSHATRLSQSLWRLLTLLSCESFRSSPVNGVITRTLLVFLATICVLPNQAAQAQQDDAAAILNAAGAALSDIQTGSVVVEVDTDTAASTQTSVDDVMLETLAAATAPRLRQRLDMWFDAPARLARVDSTQLIPEEKDKNYLIPMRTYQWSLQSDTVSLLDVDGLLLTAHSSEQKRKLGMQLPQPFAIWHLPTIGGYPFLGFGEHEREFSWPDADKAISGSSLADKLVVEVSQPDRIVLVARLEQSLAGDSNRTAVFPGQLNGVRWEFLRKTSVLPVRRTTWGQSGAGRRVPLTESLIEWNEFRGKFVPVAFTLLNHRHRDGGTITSRFDLRLSWQTLNEPIDRSVFDLAATTVNPKDVSKKFDIDLQQASAGNTELAKNLERYRLHVESVQRRRFQNSYVLPICAVTTLTAAVAAWFWFRTSRKRGWK